MPSRLAVEREDDFEFRVGTSPTAKDGAGLREDFRPGILSRSFSRPKIFCAS
jgi:hypothetical protein